MAASKRGIAINRQYMEYGAAIKEKGGGARKGANCGC